MPSSSPIRVMVVDDEPLVRRGLLRLLAGESDLEVVAESGDGSEALAMIRDQRPDLLFLDVQMPGRTGLEVLAALGADRPKAVIFVTAYDRYALDAFEQHAVDYLLKPFDDRRFAVALERARQRLASAPADEQLDRLLAALSSGRQWLERIPAKMASRVVLVPVEEIAWIEAADNYVRLHTAAGRHLVRDTLRNLEVALDPRRFARIHRSAIVNLGAVKELIALPTSDYSVVLRDGTTVTLSRSYRRQFEERLGRPLA